MKKLYSILLVVFTTTTSLLAQSYHFQDGVIEREVLENYLSKSVTWGLNVAEPAHDAQLEESFRMILNVKPKFIGRAIGLWGSEHRMNDKKWLENAKDVIGEFHKIDSTMVLQCALFEIITSKVNEVPVPEWVFVEFGLKPQKRNFRYDDMLLDFGRYSKHDFWAKDQSVPDITKIETQMWFYYLAATYIDLGVEAIHFGQVALIGSNDTADLDSLYTTVKRIRQYAKLNARRGTVLIDAHTPLGGIINSRGELLFDFHSFPLRAKENLNAPKQALLEVNYLDAIYKASMGGVTPSGWKCESLPYLVEIDNYGLSAHPGEAGARWYVWGWDEITWYKNQDEEYRNEFLRYAVEWLKENDPNGHLQMPLWRGDYRANTKSEKCPTGYSQEETIAEIFQEN